MTEDEKLRFILIVSAIVAAHARAPHEHSTDLE
jgi:hypothetical protein